MEAVFGMLRGVKKVESGYSGGRVPNPTYEEVCTGATGHAEVVQVTFDPSVISFRELLVVFFTTHDPTTPNRQGPDVGAQYRSVVFYRTQKERETALRVMAKFKSRKTWGDAPIVTSLEPFRAFYRAEEHHQKYFERNPHQPYCLIVIAPKVAKFRREFLAKLKKRRPSRRGS